MMGTGGRGEPASEPRVGFCKGVANRRPSWPSARAQRNLDLRGAAGDVFGVKILPLGKFALTLCMLVALTAPAWAHDDKPEIVPLGNDTYSIKCEGKNAFMRDEDKLRTQVNDAAVKFCADNGKVLKVISVNSKVPMFSTGYAWAKITFKALNPGSPELMPAPAMVVAAPSPAETRPCSPGRTRGTWRS